MQKESNLPTKLGFAISNQERLNFDRCGVFYKKEDLNRIRFHSTENLDSSVAKYVMCYILHELKKDFLVEAMTQKGIIDVFNVTDKVIYEFETGLTKEKEAEKLVQLFMDDRMTDFFIFRTDELPKDIHELCKYLSKKTFGKEVV